MKIIFLALLCITVYFSDGRPKATYPKADHFIKEAGMILIMEGNKWIAAINPNIIARITQDCQ